MAREQTRRDRIRDLEQARDNADPGSAEQIKAIVALAQLQGVDRAESPRPPPARIPKDHLEHLRELLRATRSQRQAAERKGSFTAAARYLDMEKGLAQDVRAEEDRRAAAGDLGELDPVARLDRLRVSVERWPDDAVLVLMEEGARRGLVLVQRD